MGFWSWKPFRTTLVVDFTLEVYTWEGIKAELEGKHQRAFRYADYGVPDQHTTFIASSEAYLGASPDAAAAFVQATRRGYAFAVDKPEEAATVLGDHGTLEDRTFAALLIAFVLTAFGDHARTSEQLKRARELIEQTGDEGERQAPPTTRVGAGVHLASPSIGSGSGTLHPDRPGPPWGGLPAHVGTGTSEVSSADGRTSEGAV